MTVGFKWVINPLCLYMSGQFLYIKKPVIPTANPPPPGSVHQLLLSVCPLLPLKAKDLQNKHSSVLKIFMRWTHDRNRV